MNILINATCIKKGGGIQVTDSICKELYKYKTHDFIIVCTNALFADLRGLEKYSNIKKVIRYELPVNLYTIVTDRNKYLDELVLQQKIDVVFTVFGPSKWNPKVIHLCGFARSQVVLKDSPYWETQDFRKNLSAKIKRILLKWMFAKGTKILYTENPFISEKLKEIFPKATIYTITNTYHQIFDNKAQWDNSVILPKFDGFTIVTISANYPHKNLAIIKQAIRFLKKKYPLLKFRFVLTINQSDFCSPDETYGENIVFLGPVSIKQCPFIYQQSDIMLLPTLLECFSASYAEAMKMRIPIITTNLEFAKSLCQNAALFYEATNAESLADNIYKLSNNKQLQEQLIINGEKQLLKFDTFEERTRKIINILENLYKNSYETNYTRF